MELKRTILCKKDEAPPSATKTPRMATCAESCY